MNTINKIPIILFSAALFLFLAYPVFGALSTQTTSDDADIMDVDKSASGTKLSGPLTIHYANFDGTANSVDMNIFLRLRKGYDLYAFATIITDMPYVGGTDVQQEAIHDWIEAEVIPELYCTAINPYTGACESELPPFAIKSVDEIVQDDPLQEFNSVDMYFAIMDITIAVQD